MSTAPIRQPTPPAVRTTHPWWLWFNILCLDAPLVALGWHLLSIRVAGVSFALLPAAMLFVIVWSIYVVDHWLDSRRTSSLFARHLFMLRGGRHLVFVAAILCAGCGALLPLLLSPLLRNGLLLMGAVVIYMLAAHSSTKWAREIFVGIMFAAGSLLTAFSLSSQRISVLPQFAMLAGACVLNCICIESREAAQIDHLTRTARRVAKSATAIGIVLATIAVDFAFFGRAPIFFISAAASALLLALLSASHRRIRPDAFRMLADAALLTPYVVLCIE